MWQSKKFRTKKLISKIDYSMYRYTIDVIDDFKLFCKIIDYFSLNELIFLKMRTIIKFLDKYPELTYYQKKLKRNFGWKSSLEKDKLYKNDKKS